jgi:hypothetical protein
MGAGVRVKTNIAKTAFKTANPMAHFLSAWPLAIAEA